MSKSPFRYPGSKVKLIPTIMEYLKPLIQDSFIDVFVGGGSVLLEVAQNYPNIKLYANDKDCWIYSFWKIISDSNTDNLNELLSLMSNTPNIEQFYKLREDKSTDIVQCAYKAIFFNRTCFSGILTSGPIGGKNQQSKYTIDCRYNFPKLKKKILECHNLLVGRTIISNNDFSLINELVNTNIPAYIDPPYVIAGDSLYSEKMNLKQHQLLGNILSSRKNWVLSYDDCSEVRNIYKNNQIIDLAARYCINGKKTQWQNKNELIILP